jgi:hypothetical protein
LLYLWLKQVFLASKAWNKLPFVAKFS